MAEGTTTGEAPPGVAEATTPQPCPPPPCGGPGYREKHAVTSAEADREPDRIDQAIAASRPRPKARAFDAELDLAELDDRRKPTPAWMACAQSLSRSNLIVRSRRMCYIGREVLIAVHMVDEQPIPLYGRVHACEYETDGTHLIDIDLLAPASDLPMSEWARSRARA
jgi:hypothetical protein